MNHSPLARQPSHLLPPLFAFLVLDRHRPTQALATDTGCAGAGPGAGPGVLGVGGVRQRDVSVYNLP